MPERSIDWLAEVRARLRSAAGEGVDAAREAEVVEELAQHLEDQYAELLGRGVDDSVARERLLAQLDEPATTALVTKVARARGLRPPPLGAGAEKPSGLRGFVASVGGDLRHGWRSLRRAPAFTMVVVLSLTIVIGANTAIFGLLDAVLLRRLPISHPEELVALHPVNEHQKATMPYDVYRTFAGLPGMPPIEAYRIDAATVAAGADQTDLWIELVSGGYFDMLRATPLLGRTLSKSDASTVAQVAVVSEDYWKQHLGGRRDVIGTKVTINEAPYTVVGVMPRSYHDLFFAHSFSLAVPLATAAALGDDVSRYYTALVARLPRGAENVAMRDLISTAYRRCCVEPPAPRFGVAKPRSSPGPDDGPFSADNNWGDTADATPHVQLADISRGITWGADFRGQYRRVLIALMGGVAVLLLIACANVGTLLLARAAAREREFAVRLSLGASRGRMRRQLLTETMELAAAGTALGVLLASLATTLLLHDLPASAMRLGDVIAWRVSPAILLFTAGTMLGCALLAGVWPARRASRVDILGALTGADRARRMRGTRIEHGLVWAQVALALILATTAALFVATLRNLERGDAGFHARHALLARINLRYIPGADYTALAHAALTAASGVPGVKRASLSYALPALDDAVMFMPAEVPGYVPAGHEPPPQFNAVSADFFTSTGIGIVAGRDFDAHDLATSEPVAIVSESFARHYLAGRIAVGASMILALKNRQQLRIVGVARDAKYGDLHGAVTEMWYMPFDQAATHWPQGFVALTIRTDLDPVSIATSVRRAITTVVPGAQIMRITSVGELLDDALARERFAAALATLFGVVALGLAALGVYGLVAYSVERRTSEIGIRMALGAAPTDALWLVMRQTLAVAAIGLAIGAPLAVLAGRAIASQLYGVSATDVRVLLGAASVLSLVAAVAGFVPGRRAARVDPVVALRAD